MRTVKYSLTTLLLALGLVGCGNTKEYPSGGTIHFKNGETTICDKNIVYYYNWFTEENTITCVQNDGFVIFRMSDVKFIKINR